jgi:hypothetical protein
MISFIVIGRTVPKSNGSRPIGSFKFMKGMSKYENLRAFNLHFSLFSGKIVRFT